MNTVNFCVLTLCSYADKWTHLSVLEFFCKIFGNLYLGSHVICRQDSWWLPFWSVHLFPPLATARHPVLKKSSESTCSWSWGKTRSLSPLSVKVPVCLLWMLFIKVREFPFISTFLTFFCHEWVLNLTRQLFFIDVYDCMIFLLSI